VTTVRIEVDTGSAVPAYEQIRAQIQTMADSGVLPAGAQLPPIRQLAADLGLAVNTVARAYRELEQAGTVRSRVRHGTVIAQQRPVALPKAERRRRLADAAAAYVLACKQLGVPAADALAAVQSRLDAED
jgi:GntR family transcriptional regulator